MKPRSNRSFKFAAALALSGLMVCSLPRGAAALPCSSGTDVRLLDDSGVSQSLKNQILKSPGLIISTASSSFPTGKLVVIRAASQDFPINSAATTAYIDEIFYSTDSTVKSIRGYFQRNSYSNFTVTKGATPSWITLSKSLSAYPPGIEANATYVQDVLKKASVDWDALDTNNDNAISVSEAQIVILVPNGFMSPPSGFASTRGVNPGSVVTPQGTFNFKNRKIITFSLKAAAEPTFDVNPIRALAAVAHELGHGFFNLPDRYGANTGTGEFDMMGSGSSSTWVHIPMHDKMKIGWIKPKIVQGHLGQCLQFVASELQDAALVVVPIDVFLGSPLEYWVIENRNKAYDFNGYDDALPDDGLAVWYTSVGTALFGHDDVRLIDFSKPTQDPDLYNNPGSNALFKRNDAQPSRALLDRNGQWNLLYFRDVSDPAAGTYPGLFMYAQF